MNDENIFEIIENEVESGLIDFKKEIYDFGNKKCKKDFIVDVMSFANSHLTGDKYIITGVDLSKSGNRDICGVTQSLIEDGSVYQSLISDNIEPTIDIDFKIIEYNTNDNNKNKLGIFKISKENNDAPYLLSKNYDDLKKGFGKVRKGQRNDYMTRRDIDEYYKIKSGNELSSICLKTLLGNKIDDYAHYSTITNPIKYKKVLSIITLLFKSINEIKLIKSNNSLYKFGENVTIDINSIENIKKFANDNSIELKEDFFDVGNLSYLQLLPYSSGSYSGSSSEKKKYQLLLDLSEHIQVYEGAHEYYTSLSNYFYLNIIIENNGKKFDEEIEIILKIEKDCFLKFEDLPIPSISIIERINNHIDEMLEIKQINGINSFIPTSMEMPQSKSNYSSLLFPLSHKSIEAKYESDVEEYKDLILSKTNYSYNYDNKYIYVKAELKSIKPNEKVKFPSILIFKNIPNFIEYEIKSKLNPNIKKGKIITNNSK